MNAIVLHEPTQLYLASGFLLGERALAVAFDDIESAEAFLARHACEPNLVAVAIETVDSDEAAFAAA